MKEIKFNASWIWCRENGLKDDKVIFRKTFEIEKMVKSALTYISVDTKYWLYVNAELVVFEGGLFRESKPGCGYADAIDIAKYLHVGTNVIVLLCWFYGNEGRNNIDSNAAGLIFECKELGLYSDESFKCIRHPAYYQTHGSSPSYLYGGYNIGFNSNLDIADYHSSYLDESLFERATIYKNIHWGKQYERPLPLIKLSEIKYAKENVILNRQQVIELPYAMSFCPYMELNAKGGEVIHICSDRYLVNGGPGDEHNMYKGHRIEYICSPGKNRFDSLYYIFGEKMVISCDESITLESVGYRESGYDCNITGTFNCDCEITNRLIKKATRTLYVCMRDNFMDCPDRERGQWIGDVSVQVPQTIFLLSDSARKLVKKAIFDFIELRKGNVLVGNVPGANFAELPAQSLNAISEIGLVAEYYKYTGDISVIELAFEPAVRYLMLWQLNKDGLLVGRDGDWRWFDHLYNCDEAVIENAWYYSALSFAVKMATILNDHRFDEWLQERKNTLKKQFNEHFWKGKFYASSNYVDERGNALAVIAGLCEKENHPFIRKILLSVFNSTVYMENYVLIALCEMGYVNDAYKRMVSRYYNLAMNENTTLWEDFYILGTKNHAWSGSTVSIAFKYFMGIDTTDGFKTFTVKPEINLFDTMSCKFHIKEGEIAIELNNKNLKVSNSSDAKYIEQNESDYE